MQLANVRRNAICVAALTLSIGTGLVAPSAQAQDTPTTLPTLGQTTPPATSGTGSEAAPATKESAFIQGMRLFAGPQPLDAIPLLTQAVSETPENGDALTALGYLETQAGHYDLAIGYLERATLIPDRLEPENALSNLAVALITKPGSTSSDRVRAIGFLEQAAAIVDPEPRTVESAAAESKSLAAFNTQMALGDAATKESQKEKAVAAFRRATVLIANDSTAWSSLGIALYNVGQESEAITALKRATAIFDKQSSPKAANAQFYAMLGNLEVKQGDRAAGQKDLETALKINKNDAVVQSNLGEIYTDQKRYAEAANAYGASADLLETSVKASPEGATLAQHKQLGSLRYRQGLALSNANHSAEISAQAIDAYEKSIAADPDNVEAMINCGALLYGAGRYDDAIRYDNLALAKRPSDKLALKTWRNLAIVYGKKHDTTKANSAWSEVAKLDSSSTDALEYKVTAIMEANPIDDTAIPLYKKLARMKSEDAEPLINLGLLYERQVPYVSTAAAKQARLLAAMQCFTEAIKRGTAAATNDPLSRASYNATTAIAYNDRGVIHEHLAEGVIHEQNGEITKAKADYKKALELKPDFDDARKNLGRFTAVPTAVVKANGKRP